MRRTVKLTIVAALAAASGCGREGGGDDEGSGLGSCAYEGGMDCGGTGTSWQWNCIPDVDPSFCNFPDSDYDVELSCWSYNRNETWVAGDCSEAMEQAGAFDEGDPVEEEPDPASCDTSGLTDAGAICMAENCCAQALACVDEPECDLLLHCVDDCTDDACASGCNESYANGIDELSSLIDCYNAWCVD